MFENFVVDHVSDLCRSIKTVVYFQRFSKICKFLKQLKWHQISSLYDIFWEGQLSTSDRSDHIIWLHNILIDDALKYSHESNARADSIKIFLSLIVCGQIAWQLSRWQIIGWKTCKDQLPWKLIHLSTFGFCNWLLLSGITWFLSKFEHDLRECWEDLSAKSNRYVHVWHLRYFMGKTCQNKPWP